MRKMGLQAIYPKPNLSKANKQHQIYPYWLRNLDIDRPDPVWASDLGSQYTSEAFTGVLQDPDIRIRMEDKGAGRDNVLVERLWRSVKYEEGYLNADEFMHHAKPRLGRRFTGTTRSRKHQTLKATPNQTYTMVKSGTRPRKFSENNS